MTYLKSILLFLVIFFGGQWLIVIALEGVVTKSSFRFSKLYDTSAVMDNEVLCFGNSRGVNAFYAPYISEKYNLKTFNLSYNGMGMTMVDLLINDYLEVHESPKMVFVEVSSVFTQEGKSDCSSFNLYADQSIRLNDCINNVNKRTGLISKVFPLYRYNNELFFRALFYFNKTDQHWINRYKITPALQKQVNDMAPFHLEMNHAELNVLDGIVDKLKKGNIPFRLFVAPYYPAYLDKIMNLDSMVRKVERSTGVEVVDISHLIMDTEKFADRVHTNELSASTIADALMESVKMGVQ